jgi:hypothetical protein
MQYLSGRYKDIGNCPAFDLSPLHYREDGSCRCNIITKEPPVWSWVKDEDGDLWKHTNKGWCRLDLPHGSYVTWEWLVGYTDIVAVVTRP